MIDGRTVALGNLLVGPVVSAVGITDVLIFGAVVAVLLAWYADVRAPGETAARLGEPQIAVDIVTNDASAVRFRNNGLVPRAAEPLSLPAYLPINASLLDAVGLMAAGWDGAPPVNAPGFPQDGTWRVRAEGLNRMP